MIFRILALLSIFFLSACGGGPDDNFVRAPDIDFECDSFQSSVCTASSVGKTFYMGLSRNTGFNCEAELENLDANLFQATFEYSGSSTVQDGGTFVWGMVTQWANSSGGKVLDFADVEYQLCAFIDMNDNGQLDPNEVVAQESFDPSEYFNPISSWVEL